MQLVDRTEFDTLMETLCAGFEKTASVQRKSAYWTGLTRMSLAQFRRCVTEALSENGPDHLPTVGGIWKIHKADRAIDAVQASADRPADLDHLAYHANRLLLQHLTRRQGVGSTGRFVAGERPAGMRDCVASAEFEGCLVAKRELVEEFCGYIREGDELATPAAFMRSWLVVLGRVSKIDKRTREGWLESIKDPRAEIPFAAHMGRELVPEQQAFA